MLKQKVFLALVFVIVIASFIVFVFYISKAASADSAARKQVLVATPTELAKPTAIATMVVVQPVPVTAVSLTVSPASIAGRMCNQKVSFTYHVVFHVQARSFPIVIEFMYTATNGRGSIAGSITVPIGATSATFVFHTTGILSPSNTFPGIAEAMVIIPDAVDSPQVVPTGQCTLSSES